MQNTGFASLQEQPKIRMRIHQILHLNADIAI